MNCFIKIDERSKQLFDIERESLSSSDYIECLLEKIPLKRFTVDDMVDDLNEHGLRHARMLELSKYLGALLRCLGVPIWERDVIPKKSIKREADADSSVEISRKQALKTIRLRPETKRKFDRCRREAGNPPIAQFIGDLMCEYNHSVDDWEAVIDTIGALNNLIDDEQWIMRENLTRALRPFNVEWPVDPDDVLWGEKPTLSPVYVLGCKTPGE